MYVYMYIYGIYIHTCIISALSQDISKLLNATGNLRDEHQKSEVPLITNTRIVLKSSNCSSALSINKINEKIALNE